MNLNAFIETRDVSKFEIFGGCQEKYPCVHNCKIMLNDGREEQVRINSLVLSHIVKQITSRVVYGGDLNHFRKYDPSPAYDYTVLPQILNHIFANRELNNFSSVHCAGCEKKFD